MSDADQALARKLNWEPPGHLDMPGSIPDAGWDHWRRFAEVAARSIVWRRIDRVIWRGTISNTWVPDFEHHAPGEFLALERHVYHGFPDPPEWALHMVNREAGTTQCLGCFDTWPEGWSCDTC